MLFVELECWTKLFCPAQLAAASSRRATPSQVQISLTITEGSQLETYEASVLLTGMTYGSTQSVGVSDNIISR